MTTPATLGAQAAQRDAEAKTFIRINKETKEIYLRDMTDDYNWPSGYNRGVQGIRKAFEYIEENIADLQQMTMYRVIDKLEEIAPKLKFHTYCAMD